MQLILAAAQATQGVIDDAESLADMLAQYRRVIEESDNARLQELCYGVCRFYPIYVQILDQLLDKPIRNKDRLILFLLVCAIHQIAHMRIPEYAAVNEAVNAVKKTPQRWAKQFINGVLRNYLRQQESFTALLQDHRLSFESFIGKEINAQWSDDAQAIFAAFNSRPPLTLRINRQKVSRDDYCQMLDEKDIAYQLGETAHSLTLLQPSAVALIPGFDRGQVSVQDESAQYAAQLLSLSPGQRVLDGCAAPGGKTGELLESEPGIALVAVDLNDRLPLIHENLARLELDAEVIGGGLKQYTTSNNAGNFDRILLDVPCSGSGVIRRHPDIKYRRQEGDLEKFAKQQVGLLSAAWTLLNAEGKLLYVTCSLLQQENDAVIAQFIDTCHEVHQGALRVAKISPSIGRPLRYGVQRLPGVNVGDGFYYCLLEKTDA